MTIRSKFTKQLIVSFLENVFWIFGTFCFNYFQKAETKEERVWYVLHTSISITVKTNLSARLRFSFDSIFYPQQKKRKTFLLHLLNIYKSSTIITKVCAYMTYLHKRQRVIWIACYKLFGLINSIPYNESSNLHKKLVDSRWQCFINFDKNFSVVNFAVYVVHISQ